MFLLAALALAACTRAADGRTDLPAGAPGVDAPSPAIASPAAPANPPGDSLLARADLGRIMGSPGAKVWMIIASDFQCPYCREWHATIAEPLRTEYVKTGNVRVAYLNFPLGQHQHAWPAAEVAMCSAAQGKFWPVHDAMFETQAKWNALSLVAAGAYFDSLAVARGVNGTALRACVGSKAVRPLIQADYERTRNAGVRSTPTIIIGSEMMPGVYPLAAYRAALDSALAKASRGGG